MYLLDTIYIEIDKILVAAIIISILIVAFVLISKIVKLNQQLSLNGVNYKNMADRYEGLLREKNLIIEKINSGVDVQANSIANTKFEDWKNKELDAHRKVIIEAAQERARALLQEWIIDEEKGLRKDAITRSMGVNFGKITEHLLPFSSHLAEFDPRDIRFIGSPVDLMIFSGATAKKSVIDIYLVEIKTGSGQLSKKQKTIREAIENHRVYWKPIVVPEFEWDIPDDDDE